MIDLQKIQVYLLFDEFSKYCESISPDITNIVNLVTLGNSFDDPKNILNAFANSDKELWQKHMIILHWKNHQTRQQYWMVDMKVNL